MDNMNNVNNVNNMNNMNNIHNKHVSMFSCNKQVQAQSSIQHKKLCNKQFEFNNLRLLYNCTTSSN